MLLFWSTKRSQNYSKKNLPFFICHIPSFEYNLSLISWGTKAIFDKWAKGRTYWAWSKKKKEKHDGCLTVCLFASNQPILFILFNSNCKNKKAITSELMNRFKKQFLNKEVNLENLISFWKKGIWTLKNPVNRMILFFQIHNSERWFLQYFFIGVLKLLVWKLNKYKMKEKKTFLCPLETPPNPPTAPSLTSEKKKGHKKSVK